MRGSVSGTPVFCWPVCPVSACGFEEGKLTPALKGEAAMPVQAGGGDNRAQLPGPSEEVNSSCLGEKVQNPRWWPGFRQEPWRLVRP